MNYFAHGRRFLDDPYYLAGTAIPDWLNVADRRVRMRAKHAAMLVNDDDPRIAAVARGVVQHHHDDDWFHRTPAFAELSWSFTAAIRDVLAPDDGLRPSFLGHILVELLLDAALIADAPKELESYYAALSSIDPDVVQTAVNRAAPRTTERLAPLIPLFIASRFLFDYLDDERLLYRLNGVMARVQLSPLPARFLAVIPEARRRVGAAKEALLITPRPSLPAPPHSAWSSQRP
jgi:hypothetical protein